MVAPTQKINVTELDFDSIKANLKAFLQSQSEFSDFDFDGSGMDTLLDLLAYNTFYLGTYASFLGNEMFLDSADQRDSIVSLAKHLDYTPQSRTAPRATLRVDMFPPDMPINMTITKGTEWTTVKDGVTHVFTTINDATVPRDINGDYIMPALPIFEGTFLDFQWTVDETIIAQKYIVPNANIDLDTLKVNVQNSVGDTTVNTFNRAGNVNVIDGTDRVYWVQEVEGGKYEIIFGNGIVGFPLFNGNLVQIEYLVTNGEQANGASVFTNSGLIGVLLPPDVTFSTVTPATGGAERESNESIKLLAPKNFSTQGRAVTIVDYQNILLSERSDIESITGWGGEEAIPPQFGRVFLAMKPIGLDSFSTTEKQRIIDTILKTNNVVSIRPNIVDPDLTYFNITSSVNYNANILSIAVSALTTEIETAVKDYFSGVLNKFGETFRFSVLTGDIDAANAAVINNQTSVVLEKRHKPILGESFTINVNYNNAIIPGTINSNKHDIGANIGLQLDDDGNGVIRCVSIDGLGNKTIVLIGAGAVDYATGILTLSLTIDSFTTAGDDRLKIFATPSNQDVVSVREQILTLDTGDGAALAVSVNSEIT